MAEKLVSKFMRSLGVEVVRRDPATEEMLASSLARRIGSKLLVAIRQRDTEVFLEIVRKGVDEPGFDTAFDLALKDACGRGWASRSECDMLRAVARNAAAEQSVEHRDAEDEFFVTFVVPVQGPSGTLDAAFASGTAGQVVADALRKTGFVAEGVDVAFLPSVYDPVDISASGPSAMRYAAASLGVSMISGAGEDQMRRSARTLLGRISEKGAAAALDRQDPGNEIRFAVGGYYRKWRPESMTADALLMSIGKYEGVSEEQARRRDQHVAHRRKDFVEEVAKVAEFRVGAPNLAPRACSQIAFALVLNSLNDSAWNQGLVGDDAVRIEPEDLVYFVDGGNLVVLAKFGDDVANSNPIPYSLVAGDIEHFRRLLGSIHPAARPMEDSYDPEPSAAVGERGVRLGRA